MAADLDAMVANVDGLLNRINVQPRQQNMAAPPRYPFYNADLNETIQNAAEEALVNQVLAMNYEQIVNLRSEVDTRTAMNPAYTSTRDYVLKCKAGIWRVHVLKTAGKFGPAPSLGELVEGFMTGWIISNEFWKRQGAR